MDAALVRLTSRRTLNGRNNSEFETDCSCPASGSMDNCILLDSVTVNVANLMRIKSLAFFEVAVLPSANSSAQWNMLVVPHLDEEDVSMRCVFRLSILSSRYRSSSAVMYDNRLGSESKQAQYRIKCALCPGAARNRGVCAHENEGLKYISF